LILGFSGADLSYDPDYLALRPAAQNGIALTVLNREAIAPLKPMQELMEAWGDKGRFITGELPTWLITFQDALGVTPSLSTEKPAPAMEIPNWMTLLNERCRAWAESLPTVSVVNMFTALVDKNQDDETMLRYLMFFRRYYRRTEDQLSPTYWRYEYNLGKRLLERGLIGYIDPRTAGLIPDRMPRDIDAKDYADAFQFLARGANLGNSIEGEVDQVRYAALKLGHGHVSGNIRLLIKRIENIEETNDLRAGFEVMLLATEFAEEFGKFMEAWKYIQAAYYCARELGDELRRAACAARAAHITAFLKQYQLAEQQAEEALQIADQLSLPIYRGDALAARGLTHVLRGYDDRAVEPLEEACAIFRRHQRRPRLTYALCDLGRAYYYSGSADKAMTAINEAKDLAETLPGLGVQVSLMELELLMAGEQWNVAREVAGELLEIATACNHEYGINHAQKTISQLSQEPGA
jgi:tetratricopeptide (TPR) repeat protein